MCVAKRHVCFTPESDRKSRHAQKAMSALHPKADMCLQLGMSALGQKRTLAASQAILFDQIVSASEERWRNGKSEGFGGPEIDSKFIFGRRLHWQISRLLTF
jgi:hypothetical protein